MTGKHPVLGNKGIERQMELTDRYKQQNEVMELFVENKPINEIAKELGVPEGVVREHIDDWRVSLRGTDFLKERVTDLLALTDAHYSKLIRSAKDVIETVDDTLQEAVVKEVAPLLGQKNSALKSIAEFEAKRIGILQQAGLLDAAEFNAEKEELERKQEILIGIIREVTSDCEHCRLEVANRLAKVTGEPPTVIKSEVAES